VRLPTFSRQTAADTAEDERPTVATGGTTPVRERRDSSVTAPDEATTTRFTTAGAAADRDKTERDKAERDKVETKADRAEVKAERAEAKADEAKADEAADGATAVTREREPVVAGPKPRASLLATLGLVLAVASALLVLSGPLLGYGIGVAVLALILSLSGIHATGKRHVAGKSDALLGMVLSLAAIVVGVLALTGSLSWLGTDMQPVNSTREWLDAQFANRF
jgi:hypothetical protein